jgi:hypothetical protein
MRSSAIWSPYFLTAHLRTSICIRLCAASTTSLICQLNAFLELMERTRSFGKESTSAKDH